MKVLALIPARGGSKSIPRKNLVPVGGKPMIAHSVGHALSAKRVDRVVVTTDDTEIAEVARRYGAEVPFLRPAELAQDHSPDFDFVHHALCWLRDNEGYDPDLVVQLRPTTPIRDARMIDAAIEAFAAAPEADSLRAVVRSPYTPYKMWRLGPDGYLATLLDAPGLPEPYNQARQLLPDVWQQDGFIDITRPRTVFEQRSITGRRILPFFLDRESIDIDLPADLSECAEEFGRAPGADS